MSTQLFAKVLYIPWVKVIVNLVEAKFAYDVYLIKKLALALSFWTNVAAPYWLHWITPLWFYPTADTILAPNCV